MVIKDPADTSDAPKNARVVHQSASRIRTLFEGPEVAARQFVERNFPRAHVEPPSQEPGIPDVHLVNAAGGKEYYHAEDGWQDGTGQPESDAS